MDTESPKPCPVCESAAEVNTIRVRGTILHYVTCPSEYDCPERPTTGPHNSEAEAIAAWNADETI